MGGVLIICGIIIFQYCNNIANEHNRFVYAKLFSSLNRLFYVLLFFGLAFRFSKTKLFAKICSLKLFRELDMLSMGIYLIQSLIVNFIWLLPISKDIAITHPLSYGVLSFGITTIGSFTLAKWLYRQRWGQIIIAG